MSQFTGRSPYTGLSAPASTFPSVLPWSEATDWIEECRESEVVLGVDGSGDPLRVDLDKTPHVLVSAPTGRGKSGVARSVAVQRLRRGDLVVVLDLKRHSHRWAQKLAPNVVYAKTEVEIASALFNLGREVHRRNEVVDAWNGPVESAPVGPRIVIVFEEMNATMAALKGLDKRLPREAYTALQGLQDVSFMGRAVKAHLISFAQMATYRASGGAEVVENYDTRVLIGHSPQTWKYLASDCGRPMTAPEGEGRGIVCRSGKAREVQLLWTPEAEAVPLVTSAAPAMERAAELSGHRGDLPPVWTRALCS